jgi:hypothetical protein
MDQQRAGDPANPVDEVRLLLFNQAAGITKRLNQRLADVAEDIAVSNALGAIGAIEGAEREIEKLRSLMILVRDNFTKTTA